MPRIDDLSKQEIKHQVWLKVQQNHGIRTAEIAQSLGLEGRRLRYYLAELRDEGKIEQEGWGWVPVEFAGPRLFRFELTPEEVVTLYLGARLLVKQHDQRSQPAETALRKLATVLRSDTPISKEIERVADELAQRPDDPHYQSIFRTIAQAYAYRKKVRLVYQPLDQKPFTTTFATYLVEPSLVGAATYIIGHSSLVDAVREFKLTRIQSAETTSETYTIPPEYQGLTLMRHAWSVIGGEARQVVVLRFSPAVASRVKETRWHPLEETSPDPDKLGWLRWRATVPSTLDMLPWIRGWGADVEVLEPEEVRRELIRTVHSLNLQYKISPGTARLLYHIPYAKTNSDNRQEIHLLLYHLIDTGQVASVIWQEVLTGGIQQRLANMLNLSIEDCGRFLSFLSALHDLGKAGPAFQNKYSPDWLKEEFKQAGLGFGNPSQGKAYDPKTRHGIITAWALDKLLPEMLGLDDRFAHKIAVSLGGHHGIWPPPSSTDHIQDDERWEELRRDIVWELKSVFSTPNSVSISTSITDQNTFFTILSGLAAVSDWVGSRNKERFGFNGQPMPTRKYAHQSRENAIAELKELGWIGWQPTGDLKKFAEVFSYLDFKSPRDTQRSVIDLASNLAPPTLLILEEPTGSGKTETALYLADLWVQQSKGRGWYIAMPTQATSNQMFDRIKAYLANRYPKELVNLHLVHGQAGWSDRFKEIELQNVGDSLEDGVVAMSWFKPRKRTLLAPFGVGTVDQTLISILQVRHFFVRLFGLAHKVVIFDEVHAYDTHMNTLFHRLLEWLNAIGTSVIILSATLPASTRKALAKHYTGTESLVSQSFYPALTVANAEYQQTIALPSPEEYVLELEWNTGREPEQISGFLKHQLENGGCAAVICNTVRRAQEIYKALSQAEIVPPEELILFHGRFPPIWRHDIETRVLEKFSKNGHRPHKAIVVATQVIEQSLDIDFDLMVTDLAPIDLILQRAGRLHRHEGNERYRLPRKLAILEPKRDEKGLPDFESDKWVYEPYILLRSYLTLQEYRKILMPTNTIPLIESVYNASNNISLTEDSWHEALRQMLEKLRNKERETRTQASQPLILDPTNRRLLAQSILDLEEDDPTTHKSFRAKTRDIDFSINVICLHKFDQGIGIFDDHLKMFLIDLDANLLPEITHHLLRNSLAIQHRGLGNHLIEQKIPNSWKENPVLRYSRYLIFKDGVCQDIPGYRLRLSSKLGLEIIKLEDT